MPWAVIIPGIVEIVRELVPLFKKKGGVKKKKQRDAFNKVKALFPDIKDSQTNLLIELVVQGWKKGLTEDAKLAAFVHDSVALIDTWGTK